MLTTSFDIMGDGMEVEQYMKFRNTLTPASGFQSAQYRLIEFSSTDLINLIDYRFRATIDRNTPYSHAFEHLYWQAAGKDYHTGEKSYLILEFERKYKDEFLRYMEEYNTINLWQKFKQLPEEDQKNPDLVAAMRHYDKTVNITWVMGHLNAAKKYIESGTWFRRSNRRKRLEKIHASKIPKTNFLSRTLERRRIKKLGRTTLRYLITALFFVTFFTACNSKEEKETKKQIVKKEPIIKEYGFTFNDYKVVKDTIRSGDTFSATFAKISFKRQS
jgi:hypothetical protein